jgi:simple sugar transport system ATP-binding protein
VLEARRISRRFGPTVALDRVDFDARAGEIHALLGENGAGKTTLMNVIAGALAPDSGELTIAGRPLASGSPHAALDAGIAAVHQSPLLFERITWEENLALGGVGRRAWRIDLAAVARRARAQAEKLGFELPPAGALVERRSVAEQVRLEVLRALSFEPRLLMLDEPTGLLAPHELASFLELLRRLRADGRAVILITHKLGEALEVADRITVLRRGRVVMSRERADINAEELARAMIGDLPPPRDDRPSGARRGGVVVLIEGLTLAAPGRTLIEDVSLVVERGEVAGIAGVDGNGQTELVEVLAGVRQPSAGRFTVAGGESTLAVIPQNRDLDGLILDMPLWENLLLAPPLLRRVNSWGWLDRDQARALGAELISRFRIDAPNVDAAASALSGGNRQRLAVARAIASEPAAIVAHNITRGLDLRAAAQVQGALRDFAAAGGAVLLLSSDLDELLAVCGRLYVMSRGRLRETAPDERDPGRLGLLMAGAWR